MNELFFEESARLFERLEQELSLGRRDWAVRMPVHRAGDSLQCAFALPRGAAATKGSPPPGMPTFPSFQETLRDYGRRCGPSPEEGKLVAAP